MRKVVTPQFRRRDNGEHYTIKQFNIIGYQTLLPTLTDITLSALWQLGRNVSIFGPA